MKVLVLGYAQRPGVKAEVDRWLPWLLAVAFTYAVAAYVILPRAVRIGLYILRRQRVPSFTVTGDGLPGDPVNLEMDVIGKYVRGFVEHWEQGRDVAGRQR